MVSVSCWRPPSAPRSCPQLFLKWASPFSKYFLHGGLLLQSQEESLSLECLLTRRIYVVCVCVNKITGVIAYYFCHILLVRSKFRSCPHSRRWDYTKTWTPRDWNRWWVTLGYIHHTDEKKTKVYRLNIVKVLILLKQLSEKYTLQSSMLKKPYGTMQTIVLFWNQPPIFPKASYTLWIAWFQH